MGVLEVHSFAAMFIAPSSHTLSNISVCVSLSVFVSLSLAFPPSQPSFACGKNRRSKSVKRTLDWLKQLKKGLAAKPAASRPAIIGTIVGGGATALVEASCKDTMAEEVDGEWIGVYFVP